MTATTRSVPVSRDRGPVVRALARPELGAVIGVVVTAVYFSTRTDSFATAGGFAAVLDIAAPVGIMSVAVALLLIGGEFDLSAGVLATSCGLVAGLLVDEYGVAIWEAIGWSLLFALAVGLLNGLLVTRTRVPSFIVTLGSFFALQGLNLGVTRNLTGEAEISGLDAAAGFESARVVFASTTLTVGGGAFHAATLWWVAVTLLGVVLLGRTKFGNWIYGSGGAPESARRIGVPVTRTKVLLFMGTAAAAWLVGTISAVRLTSVQAGAGVGDEFVFIICAVIGGCLLTGGVGSALGAALGALVYGMAREGIVLAGWDRDWFALLLGGTLIAAVLINTVVVRHRSDGQYG